MTKDNDLRDAIVEAARAMQEFKHGDAQKVRLGFAPSGDLLAKEKELDTAIDTALANLGAALGGGDAPAPTLNESKES